MNRRELLVGMGLVGLAAHQQAIASQPNTLVTLFLRGGADGLSFVAPYADAAYRNARPQLAIQPPDAGTGTIDLDGQFGLHPSLTPLHALYSAGELAFVQAAGMPHGSRSHFLSQSRAESGAFSGNSATGWLGRHLQQRSTFGAPLRSIAFTHGMPMLLRGDSEAAVLPSPDIHQWLGGMPGNYKQLLETLHSGSGPELADEGAAAITLADTLDTIQPWNISSSVSYSSTGLGKSLGYAAQFIKAGVGTEAIHIDVGGWDSHINQAAQLTPLLADLAANLSAFHGDIGSGMNNVTVIVMSEFGRRVAQNASSGTDHGKGGCFLALGGGVNGGQVYSDWPGLEPDNLDAGDLAITTDTRQLIWECLQHRQQASDPDLLFPGFTPGSDTGLFYAS